MADGLSGRHGGDGGPFSDEPLEVLPAAALVDAAPDGMLVVGDQGEILLVNRQLEELFGYARDELIGQPVEALIPEGARPAHRAHRARFRAAPTTRPMGVGLQLLGRRKDGTAFPVEISLSPLDTDDGLRVVAAVRDITERLAKEQEAQQAQQEVAVLEDRQRIARDLHDRVIQRLFAAGLGIEAVRGRVNDPLVSERLEQLVGDLDATITELRSSIFALNALPASTSLRAKVIDVCADERQALGFDATVRFSGPVDTVDESLRDHLLAVLREALSNVARHAQASTVQVTVDARDGLLLRVEDDGVGPPPTRSGRPWGRGLGNMAARADKLGGEFTLEACSPQGTSVTWRVPVD
jgi:PAS domain S-box-containing protein